MAKFERSFHHSAEVVWAALTENDKLVKWFHNLEVVNLQKDGIIRFNMNDGTGSSFDIKITDFEDYSVLQFEWGPGWVRFELAPYVDGCLLVLKEFIPELVDHTSKDLAGWHVCLDVLSALLDGNEMDFPKDDWEKRYGEYSNLVQQMKN